MGDARRRARKVRAGFSFALTASRNAQRRARSRRAARRGPPPDPPIAQSWMQARTAPPGPRVSFARMGERGGGRDGYFSLECALEGVMIMAARSSSTVIQMAAGVATGLEVAVEVARATNQRAPRTNMSSSTCPLSDSGRCKSTIDGSRNLCADWRGGRL